MIRDARTLGSVVESVDLFVSNNTLEHIPPVAMREILTEFRNVGTETSISSHYMDMSDHYARFDSSITPLNFYRFSSGTWRLFNNDLHYQNRLRHSDYVRLFQDAGLSVVEEEREMVPETTLSEVDVSREFQGYSEQDLRTTSAWIVARSSGG